MSLGSSGLSAALGKGQLAANESTLLAKLEERMGSGQPFTYAQLSAISDGDQGRIADKTIQRWRCCGWISFERKGRDVWWSLTQAARDLQQKSGLPLSINTAFPKDLQNG